MKQLICLENWLSLVKSGGICKTLSVLDWNVTMFLHFRPALQMLPNGRVLLSWAWLMYSHCMYLLFRRLKLLRAPGVSRDRMFFFGEILQDDSLSTTMWSSAMQMIMWCQTDWIHCLFAAMTITNILIPRQLSSINLFYKTTISIC